MIRISVVRNGHWAEDYMRSTVNTVLNMKGIVVKKLYGIIGNNAMYITLRQYLNGMFGQEIRFEVAENVFFDNQESNRNCYKDLPAE